ncbi:MAG: V-type ATP synthase subunit I [Methanomassiliicoccaceae archaeon]|jgi:V/A-type H+-transporting ATPase subunit I|nr:V-type ATP synthase subunit I [Methanomassiliicoccaceae archaeon]
MLLPEPMSRIVIAGSKSNLDEAIDALYGLKMIHLIDHTVGSDEGFSIGAPRPYVGKTSERLLSLRAVEKELGINFDSENDEEMSVGEVRAKISSNSVEAIGGEVFKVLDRRNAVAQKMAEETARRDDLRKISGIPVDLELYRGYDSLAVAVGSVKADPSAALAGIDSELFMSGGETKKESNRVIALFVKKADKEAALRLLADFEFSEIAVPAGTGPAAAAAAESETKIASMKAEVDEAEKELAALKEKHGTDIIALDEELSIEERKGSTPLRIATSEYSFIIDAWVPTAKVAAVLSGMDKAMGGKIFVESQEDRSRSLHDVEHAEPRFKETPTKMKNGAYATNFEYPVKLLSPPKYHEIDPTIILSIFFPLFFGFMVGDIGYAIPFMILGAYGLKTAKSKDFKAIATILFFGGLWAFVFGFFFYAEMFGMHFIGAAGADGITVDGTAVTWQSLLGVTFPDWFSGIFPDDGHGISKLHAVTFLLKISIYIGIIHILIGYIVGFINVKMQHGFKEAFFEKGGWMLSFLGVVALCWGMTEILIFENGFEGMVLIMFIVGIALIVAGAATTMKKEGGAAIMELPGLMGNILSYARLTAIGMSKAGMALAFNYLGLVMFATEVGGVMGIVCGALILIVGHLMIFTLAILSAGLHSLRLQYVEMMSKFFGGGGKEYEPLEIKRKNTKIVETEV